MIALWMLSGCGSFGLDSYSADSAALCEEDEALFVEAVWEPVLGKQCVVCHVEGGQAGGTALVLSPDDMMASLRSASLVSDRLLLKPTGATEDGHGGGTLISPESPAHAALSFWVDWSDGECVLPDAEECAPVGRRLRRLSHDEYDRTIDDLLDVGTAPATGFAADEVVEGFNNDAEALMVSSLLADQYRAAAEALADEVALEPLLSCIPESIGHAACATVFIEDFGTRAFRRPISESELERYLELWEQVAVEDGFEVGIRWVITAMLQSPHFLYRSELGEQDGAGRFVLTPWEEATALSYLFWGSTPDAALLEAAESGELDTAAEVARLAADERALEITADFVEVWLQLDRLQTVSREGLTDDLRDSMRAETRAMVMDVAASGGTLSDLMLDGEQHTGLLTQASVLTTHGLSDGSGPIQRGVVVRERLLCEPLAPPPPNVDASAPEVDPDASTRDRYTQHSVDPQCAACHTLIDPLGFGFEHFDQLGRWRDSDNGHPIDATGSVDGIAFDGVSELAEVLLEDARFAACYSEMWQRWGTGAASCGTDLDDAPLTEPRQDILDREDFTIRYGGPEERDTLATGTRLVLESLPEDDDDYGTLTFVLSENNAWDGGWCADAAVTNSGTQSVTWEVREALVGEISSIWNAEAWEEDGETVFIGVDWNDTLAPGERATFGFCAND